MNLPISRLLILISFFLFFSIRLEAQTKWSLINVTGTDLSTWFIDKDVKKKPYGIIAVWEKVIYQNQSYSIALNEWNCSDKMRRLMELSNYNEAGDFLSGSSTPSPWKYVVPDSVEAGIYSIVCGNSNKNRFRNLEKSNANSSFAKIIVKKGNLRSEPNANSEVIREVGLGEKLVLVTEDSVGVWYKVLDLKTNSQGWLHGNNFKIIKAKTSGGRFGKGRKN
jgi:Bacterial SH3 domain